MNIRKIVVGQLDVNCYIISDGSNLLTIIPFSPHPEDLNSYLLKKDHD